MEEESMDGPTHGLAESQKIGGEFRAGSRHRRVAETPEDLDRPRPARAVAAGICHSLPRLTEFAEGFAAKPPVAPSTGKRAVVQKWRTFTG